MQNVISSIEKEKAGLFLKARELEIELNNIQRKENKLKIEIEDVNYQISYYYNLTKEMKRDINPPKLRTLLKDMRKG